MTSYKEFNVIAKSSRRLGRQKTRRSCINEDFKYIDNKNNLYIIADGLGGHRGGDEASRIAVQTLVNRLSRFLNGLKEGSYLEDRINNRLKEAIEYTNSEVIYPISYYSRANQDFGTTLALVFYYNGKSYISHVGDSRIYLFRDEKLECLTKDDNAVSLEDELSKDESHIKFMNAPLSQYIGKKEIEVHSQEISMGKNDMILMATDGLTDVIHESEIKDILLDYSFDEAPSRLAYRSDYPQKIAELYSKYNKITIRKAKGELGGKDNITFILLKFQEVKNVSRTT